MIVEFDKSFLKSISKIKDSKLKSKIENAILEMEQVPTIFEISNCKKLTGFASYYRKRIGDYRIGFEKISDDRIVLIIISHRSEIYSTFP